MKKILMTIILMVSFICLNGMEEELDQKSKERLIEIEELARNYEENMSESNKQLIYNAYNRLPTDKLKAYGQHNLVTHHIDTPEYLELLRLANIYYGTLNRRDFKALVNAAERLYTDKEKNEAFSVIQGALHQFPQESSEFQAADEELVIYYKNQARQLRNEKERDDLKAELLLQKYSKDSNFIETAKKFLAEYPKKKKDLLDQQKQLNEKREAINQDLNKAREALAATTGEDPDKVNKELLAQKNQLLQEIKELETKKGK